MGAGILPGEVMHVQLGHCPSMGSLSHDRRLRLLRKNESPCVDGVARDSVLRVLCVVAAKVWIPGRLPVGQVDNVK